MASLPPKLRASAVDTWLLKVSEKIPLSDTWAAARRTQLVGAAKAISEIKDGFWFTTQVENATKAWNLAAKALVDVGMGAKVQNKKNWAEVAWSHVDAVGGVAERHYEGESMGLPSLIVTVEDTIEDAMLLVEDVGAAVAETTKKEVKTTLWIIRNANWLVPVVVVPGAGWYFWPVIGAALRARKLTRQRLDTGVDAGMAKLDEGIAGITGQAARAFEPEFEVDPYADTLDIPTIDPELPAQARWATRDRGAPRKAPQRRYLPEPTMQRDDRPDFDWLPSMDDN